MAEKNSRTGVVRKNFEQLDELLHQPPQPNSALHCKVLEASASSLAGSVDGCDFQ
jgi:hypothetical protein